MSYKQLTQEQRYQIEAYIGTGMKRSEIAREIGVHRSTVGREIDRNSDLRLAGYRACAAIAETRIRHERKRKKRVDKTTWATVGTLLRLDWSPEQVTERLKLEGLPTVSHETIYLHIYQNKLKGGDLYRHLRRRPYGYRKRIHKYCKRVGWDTRRPIAERPAVVETRARLGDWEIDTIVGRERKGGVVTLVERHSRLCLLRKVSTKSPDAVAEAVCEQLAPVKDKVLTVTSDNGFEFRRHRSIAERLDADFFFAAPYAPWQRGTVENTNGLVRQYFPKKTDFSAVPDNLIRYATDRLNNRPRKALGFRTPNEIFHNQFVALIT